MQYFPSKLIGLKSEIPHLTAILCRRPEEPKSEQGLFHDFACLIAIGPHSHYVAKLRDSLITGSPNLSLTSLGWPVMLLFQFNKYTKEGLLLSNIGEQVTV